jgi:putative restriction endonuclease
MTPTELIAQFERLRPWSQNGERAVHKPLLALLALGRIANGNTSPMTFPEIEEKLKELLEDFGRKGSAKTAHNPFWHLQSDGIWKLEGPSELLNRPMGATPNKTELRQPNVQGHFTHQVLEILKTNPELVHDIAHRMVENHFPSSIAQDVLDATGIPPLSAFAVQEPPVSAILAGDQNINTQTRRRRDPAFREKVLVAYEYRCCVCGYDLRLGRQIVGVEAAHIRWFQFDGPDTTNNGLALCATHHKMFDLGAFTVAPETLKIFFQRWPMETMPHAAKHMIFTINPFRPRNHVVIRHKKIF